ncbi:MAG: hypothetical protein AVDCRST_MAG77-2028 [uncultured Chloroflexi bacterium]|uniref:Adenylate cyclase n=1 Tax=uncultured Chloroflexota bacterium TaxID=166587 RepID=A0A6J4IGY9_9CHLR|nr:MAG: hypothetical protein AVDCRST_MAG77-2028 [uncultured Chloroflexota bacterium]
MTVAFAAAVRWRRAARDLRPLTLLVFAICAAFIAYLNLRANATGRDIEATNRALIFSIGLMPPAFTVARLGFLYGNAASLVLGAGWVASTITTGRYPVPATLYYLGIIGGVHAMSAAAGYVLEALFRREYVAARLLDAERQRAERLLLNVLPAAIAPRLKPSPSRSATRSM